MFRAVVTVLLILVCLACGSVPKPNNCPLPEKSKFPDITRTVFLSDNFTGSGVDDIHSALMEWTQVTRGSVKWTLGHMPTDVDLGNGPKGVCSNSIIIIPVLSDWDIVKRVEESQGSDNYAAAATIMSCEFNLMILVVDRIGKGDAFKSTVLHELGHFLKLQHSKDKTSLMYPDDSGSATCVTPVDIKQFCDIWSCDPGKMDPCK